jgi:hypothetical protein
VSLQSTVVAERDIEILRDAFAQVFNTSTPRAFGSRASGYSDGNDGVQWNAGLDLQSGVAWLGVNLEGKAYDGWPIARLIQRERRRARLFEARDRLSEPDAIRVLLRRDAWGPRGSRMPHFREHWILPMGVTLDQLDKDEWKRSLEVAQRCLATPEGKRAKEWITLQDGQRVEIYVSPHLSFERALMRPRNAEELRDAFHRARRELQPLYDFVQQQGA